MKSKSIWMMTLCVAGLGTGFAILGCKKETTQVSEVSAAERAAAQETASELAAAEKAAAQAQAEAAALQAAGQKTASELAVAEQAAADRAAADKAAAEEAVADKAAAEKAAAQAQAEAAALPLGLVEMKAEITRMTAQIDLTMAKLEALCAATGDLEKPSENALGAIEALDAEAQIIKKRGEKMRDRGAAYFELWEKQLASMSTPEVAEIAAQRKEELSAKYAEVLTAMQETRAAMDAYWSDMTKIRKVIEEDLTPDSQKLLAPQVQTAKDKSTTLKSRIEGTFAKLGEVSLIYANR